MTRLIAEAVSVTLGETPALRDVSFMVETGEMVGLIGPNGAGKTTLLRALTGLAPVDGGSVRIDGQPLAAIERRRLARTLAYLPNGAPCHWPVTVRRVVALGRLPHGSGGRRSRDTDHAAVENALAITDIAHLAGRRMTTLSSGERVRALLARAIAAGPDILLADEPTSSLDPYHQLHVMDLLRARAEAGAGVVAVLHDLTLAARFCHRVVLLHQGRMLANGRPNLVLTPENIRAAYGVEAQIGEFGGRLYLVPWNRLAEPEPEQPDLPGAA